METSDWIALASAIAAVAAVVYTRQSVKSARRSADEAARMRQLDEDRRGEERERWHHECEPKLPAEIDARYRSSGEDGDGALFGEITVPRMYRVRAEAVSGASRRQLSLDTVTRPDQPIEFMIEPRPPGATTVNTEEIVFRFWPPVEDTDGTGLWSCGCGRPNGQSMSGPGHWERPVRVRFRQPNVRWL